MDTIPVPEDLFGGNSNAFSVTLESITLLDGIKIRPPRSGITVIVGGNNVGKSTLLKQVSNAIDRPTGDALNTPGWQLVRDVEIDIAGDARDCTSWLIKHHGAHVQSGGLWFGVRGQSNANEHGVRTLFRTTDGPFNRLGAISGLVKLFGDPWSRPGAIVPQEMRDSVDSPPVTPFHYLQDSPQFLTELREICIEVFRQDLTLDVLARQIQLRVGTVKTPAPPVDAITAEYREELSALPPLTDQGDGMKSLIGLILPLIAAVRPIVLIDEPEAFLHPPQANALGRVLGGIARRRNLQIILATHDKNLLAGILASSADVTVVRLDRTLEGKSTAHKLEVDEIRELWSDPLLKYTNVFEALFHRITIITEADQDCRFYSAALGEYEPKVEIPIPADDVLFVPSYGKAALHKLVSALRSIYVPVVAVADMDILNDEANISRLVSSFGCDWSSLKNDYRIATEPFRGSRSPATIGDVATAVNAVFSGRESEPYSPDAKREMQAQLRTHDSPWGMVKKFGQLAFEGQAAPAVERLLGALDSLGVVLVRVGELERFAPGVAVAKGPSWLTAALETGAHRSAPAREHMQRCVSVLGPSPR